MSKIPNPPMDFDPLMNIIMGAKMFKALVVAVKYDVFTLCQEPKTVEEISKELVTDARLTKKLLNALTTMGLLVSKGDRYENSPLANTFLVKDKMFYQGNYIKLIDSGYDTWKRWDQALKEGINAVPKEEISTEDLEKVIDPTFTLAMAEFAICGGVQNVVEVLSKVSEFKNAKRMLDLGGGTGVYSIGLVLSNPNLEVTIFDIPSVLEVSKRFISNYGVEKAFKLKGGNYVQDDIGAGYDVVFASHTLYGYPKAMLLSILKKIWNALNDGGILVSNHFTLNEDGSDHKITVFWDIWLTLLSYGITAYRNDEYVNLFKEAGFSILRIIDISTPSYPSTLVIGKKGM